MRDSLRNAFIMAGMLAAICAVAGACDLINPPNQGAEYKGVVSGTVIDTSIDGARVCKDRKTLTGLIWVGVVSETRVEGDGGVNLQVSGNTLLEGDPRLCGGSGNPSTGGDWTARLAGSPSNLSFSIEKSGSTAGGFSETWKLTFSGVLTPAAVMGKLAFNHSTSATSEGRPTRTVAEGTIDVTMVRCDDAGSCGK